MAVIKDVAKLAGVSVGTVSKILNNSGNVKEENRKKVEQAIKKLNYQPNPLARTMRTGKTNTIAVIVPDVSNPFFSELYNVIRFKLIMKGLTSILYSTEDNIEILEQYLASTAIYQVDGIILCFVNEDERIFQHLKRISHDLPIINIGWNMKEIEMDSILVDVYQGTYEATSYMIGQEFDNLAYIAGPEKTVFAEEKYQGYLKAMQDNGKVVEPQIITRGSHTLATGYHGTRKIMHSVTKKSRTGIITANDLIAIGCLKYLLQNQYSIPQEVAVMGFDNISLSFMYQPALSTMSIPIERIGHKSVDLLLHRLAHPNSKIKQLIFKTQLILRESTEEDAPQEVL